MNRLGDKVLFISALEKENMEHFRKKVYEAVRKIHITRFPYNNFLYPEYDKYGEDTRCFYYVISLDFFQRLILVLAFL